MRVLYTIFLLSFLNLILGEEVRNILNCSWRSLEDSLLKNSTNKDFLKKSFNPPNFASPDFIIVYFIRNATTAPESECYKLEDKLLPQKHFRTDRAVTMTVWTRTPVYALVAPFVILFFGTQQLLWFDYFSPFVTLSSTCVFLGNDPNLTDCKVEDFKELTAQLSLYSIRFVSIKENVNAKSFAIASDHQESFSSITAQFLYSSLIILSLAYIPIAIRYKQTVYDYVVQKIKKKLSIPYNIFWGLVIACFFANFVFFIPRAISSLIFILQNPHIMDYWGGNGWIITYNIMLLVLPLSIQYAIACSIDKEENVPYPRTIECLLCCFSYETKGILIQFLSIWMIGTFLHLIAMSLPFVVLAIAASPPGNLSFISFIAFSFLAVCCLTALLVTIDRMFHWDRKTRTTSKETFYLAIYYVACFCIAVVAGILMLVLCSMTTLDKVQTKPGVTNMLTFLIAPLLLASLGWLTRLMLQRIREGLDNETNNIDSIASTINNNAQSLTSLSNNQSSAELHNFDE